MKSTGFALALVVCALACSSCAADWEYFWNGDGSGSYTPANSSGGYTPTYSSPTPYSAVESEDQKMRNYRQDLDRRINDAVY